MNHEYHGKIDGHHQARLWVRAILLDVSYDYDDHVSIVQVSTNAENLTEVLLYANGEQILQLAGVNVKNAVAFMERAALSNQEDESEDVDDEDLTPIGGPSLEGAC